MDFFLDHPSDSDVLVQFTYTTSDLGYCYGTSKQIESENKKSVKIGTEKNGAIGREGQQIWSGWEHLKFSL